MRHETVIFTAFLAVAALVACAVMALIVICATGA